MFTSAETAKYKAHGFSGLALVLGLSVEVKLLKLYKRTDLIHNTQSILPIAIIV
jgi:hypothetical protein